VTQEHFSSVHMENLAGFNSVFVRFGLLNSWSTVSIAGWRRAATVEGWKV
jgi:hypothetical protein